MTIIAPSKIMKTASSPRNKLLSNPPASSTHLYADLTRIVNEATNKPQRKPLKSFEEQSETYAGFLFPIPFLTRKANSPQQMAKRTRETTWKMRPANIMFLPRSREEMVLAVEAMPPPAPWRTREMKSQVQKMRV